MQAQTMLVTRNLKNKKGKYFESNGSIKLQKNKSQDEAKN